MKLWNETTPRKNILCGQLLHCHMGQVNSAREKSPLGVYCFICCHSFDQIIGADTFADAFFDVFQRRHGPVDTEFYFKVRMVSTVSKIDFKLAKLHSICISKYFNVLPLASALYDHAKKHSKCFALDRTASRNSLLQQSLISTKIWRIHARKHFLEYRR